MKLKILITGAAGFIGSALAKKILDECDWEVFALDNNFRYSFEFLNEIKNEKLHIIRADICDSDKMKEIFKNNFDFVVHLAALPGERLCKKYPEETIRTNIYGVNVILDQVVSNNTKGFLFASSQVIYGSPKEIPIRETHPMGPYDLYSFSKAADEMLIDSYRNKGLNVVIFRFSSVYGHGVFARWDEVLGRFVKLANEQDYLTIYKPFNLEKAGEQVVDLIHVRDIAGGIIQTINNFEKAKGQTYNLSYGSAVSILELANAVKDITKEKLSKDLAFKFMETQEEEMSKLEVSSDKIRNDIGWTPKITIKEGINELFDKYHWYKEKYGQVKEPAVFKTPMREILI